MKTEVKVAIVGSIAMILVAIISGVFGYLNTRKPESTAVAPALSVPPAPSTMQPSQSGQGNNGGNTIIINGNNNNNAGGNITNQGGTQ
jgi:hypothetical protein